MGVSGLRLGSKRADAGLAAERPSSARPVEYDGILQGVGNGTALGWAAVRDDPDTRVAVALVVDGELVAEGVADVPRPDLCGNDLGDGAHGFLISLPERLRAPAHRSILVLAGRERTPIPAAPSFWQEPGADGGWGDVVFEPGGELSGLVPPPPRYRPPRAIVEADGWLFSEDDYRAELNAAELQQSATILASNAQRCAELDIAYIPALVPRKSEFLARARDGEGASLATELRARLRDVDGVDLVDLLEVLHDASRHGAPYHRTDADWNDRGAFFLARALLKEASKRDTALQPPALADLHLRSLPTHRGTLADAEKLQHTAEGPRAREHEVESELGVAVDVSRLQALRMPVERYLAQAAPTHVRVYSGPVHDERARLAVVGDAAALALIPWLAERTSRTTFFWTRNLPTMQLELELPRVVLHLPRETDLPFS